MVHTQREQIWQQRITDWQASGLLEWLTANNNL